MDGIIVNTKTITAAQYTGTNLTIGARCTGTNGSSFGNYFQGYLNDVRIYNHCLSDKEVEEIAKGLVLHYKLDNNGEGSRNLLLGTYNFDNWYLQNRWTKDNNIATYTEGSKTWHDMDSPTIPWTDVQGKTLTISADIRSDDFNYTDGSGFSICFVRKASGPNATGYSTRRLECTPIHLTVNQITSEWKRYSATVANISDSSFNLTFNGGGGDWFGIYIWNYTNKSMQIKNIKLEIGNKATHYSQAPEDIGINENIIYDSSGYNNNGTVIGNLTANINNSRYSCSTIFDGTSRIMANSLPAETKTLTCWAKTTKNKSTSQQIVADSNSALTISFYQGTIIGVFGTTRSTGSKSTLGSEYKENDWNFFAVVKTSDDGKRDIYCNGIKLTPTSNDYWSAATGFFIGARNASQGNPFYGEISDVRAYATALTAEQIKELYNTSVTIDNKGNIYARELVEI